MKNKNEDNINHQKLIVLKRDIIDKTVINNLLFQKSNLTYENYLVKYNNMKIYKNDNVKEIKDLVY